MTDDTNAEKHWPQTYAEAVAWLLRDLSPEAKAEIAGMQQHELIQMHFGPALWVRNNYGLWQGNRALRSSCHEGAERRGMRYFVGDPHGSSNLITRGLWEALKAQPPPS